MLLGLALQGGSASGSARQLRVAYVTDVAGSPSLHNLRGVALLGFEKAVKDFQVQARVVQYDARRGAKPPPVSLARQKYDLIIGLGQNQAGDLDTAARRFPGQKFLIVDIPWQALAHRPKNVLGSDWRVEEPAYLVGYLAALMEKRRPGRDVIGSVEGYPIPSVKRYIAGFEAGANKAVPGITTLRGYAFSFFDPAKCKAVALRQIESGAGMVFNVAGACGDGSLEAAKEKDAFGVGVDVDQSSLGGYILTSVLKRWDVNVFETVRALVHGKIRTGRNSVWSLRNGAVGLGKISPRVPPAFRRRVEAIRTQIIEGRIKVPAKL